MKIKKIIRIAVAAVLLAGFVMPQDADAVRRRRSTQAAQSQEEQTAKKQTPTQTVTQSTQEAARKASNNNNTTTTNTNTSKTSTQQKNQGKGGLKKISVERPDLEAIRIATLDPSNKFYFPKLMAKYERKDTLMTPEEFRYLYLGYMFQEDYDPYRESPYASVADSILQKKELTKADTDTIRKYTEKVLQDNPFDLRQMSLLVRVLKERGKPNAAKIWEYRLENLLGAIKSTGTGEDMEHAWFVIYPVHEYDMVQLLGYEAVDMKYFEPGYDYLVVEPDGTIKHRSPAKGFYFNVLVPQQQYELKHPDEG